MPRLQRGLGQLKVNEDAMVDSFCYPNLLTPTLEGTTKSGAHVFFHTGPTQNERRYKNIPPVTGRQMGGWRFLEVLWECTILHTHHLVSLLGNQGSLVDFYAAPYTLADFWETE